MIRGAADSLLDFSVLPGYSRVGWEARRALGLLDPVDRDLSGRVCVVTGATGGLGLEAAGQLAELGATLVLVGRSEERLAGAHDAVAPRAAGEARVETVVIDLASLESVRHGAGVILEFHPEIHALVNNAGVLLGSRQESVDGFELTFATNVLGPFLLTELLLGALEAGAEASGEPSRIVSVSSGGMYTAGVDLSDLQSGRDSGWSGSTVYARTKRMQLMVTEVWARRLAARGITANAMHPGWADTPGVQDSLPAFHRLMGPVLRSPAEGADTITWLVADPGVGATSGAFWHDRRRRATSRLPGTRPEPGDEERLVVELRRLSGLDR